MHSYLRTRSITPLICSAYTSLPFSLLISHHQALQPLHPRDDDVEEGVEGGGGEADEGLRQGEQEAVDAHDEQQLQKDIECAAVDDLPEADDVNMGELLRRNSVPKKLQGQEQQQQQPDVISKKSKHIGLSRSSSQPPAIVIIFTSTTSRCFCRNSRPKCRSNT